MKITRLVELSLVYKIQEVLSVQRLGEVLNSVDYKNYNLKFPNVQASLPFKIYVDNQEQSSGFTVNYSNGIVMFDTSINPTSVVKADYYYCPVHIYDESSSAKDQNNDFKYPAVAIYEDDSIHVPYELGNPTKEIHSTWVIEVCCERGGERNDITDMIMEMFNDHIDIIDYNLGFPLNTDGTKNLSFDPNNIAGVMYADSINYNKGGSLDIGDKPKYLSQIYVDLVINR